MAVWECQTGCPSCTRPPKCAGGNEPLSKAGARPLLESRLRPGVRPDLAEPPAAPPDAPGRPGRAAGVVLAHSLGGLREPGLTGLVQADRAAAEQVPVLDRLLTPAFRAEHPDLAFLFQQMGTFNTAKMADLRNLNSDGPTIEELDAAPFPVLLLAGEKDGVLSPGTVRRAGELLAHARVEVVPGAPHSMYWETPALFNDAVGRFLAGVAAASHA